MFVGQRITFIKDDLPPLQSPHTDMVLAWVTCGGSCLKGSEYLDTIQAMPDGTEKRQVTWRIDDSRPVEFDLCDGKKEKINFDQFRKRWMSEEWVQANLNHPIAYLKMYRENEKKIRDWLKRQKPAVLIQRNNKTAIIPADCPEAKKAKILAELRS